MLFQHLRDQQIDGLIQLRPILRWARNDQRCPRFIDQNGIDFIHNSKVVSALIHLVQLRFHIVTQIVKAQLIVGGIGHIASIGCHFFRVWLLWINNASGQAQGPVNFRHPIRITPGQIIVNRHNMHTLARQSIEIGREGGNQSFALTSFHFSDIALMQKYPAHELHIKGSQAQRAFRCFAAIGEGFRQKAIKRFSSLSAILKLFGFCDELLVAERFKIRLKRINLINHRAGCFDLAIIWCAKNFSGNCS